MFIIKIALIGCYPPPYGGISIHVKRLKIVLDNNNIENVVFNDKIEDLKNSIKKDSLKKTFLKLIYLKYNVLHFHIINKKGRMLIPIYRLLGKKVILTVHGESLIDQIKESNFIEKKILLNGLKRLNKIITVNPKTNMELIDLGVNKNKLVTIPAYINPIKDSKDYNLIPKEVYNFINSSNFLISVNGWIRFYKKEDLYGIDLSIELINKLINSGYNVSLFIALLGIEEQNHKEKEYYLELKNKIKKYNLEKYIFIYEVNNTEFYPILEKSNLFIRPTNIDGDAISIREALYYKIPTIASDVVIRPKEVILFKNRDLNNLYSKVIYVMKNYKEYKEKIKDLDIEDNSNKILKIYKNLTN
ncbi:glycosyltransferase [Clostridium fallax]|uniref:Glycosyltransferase involved in cell wall bisynthesis n=1 Tax=Clostridium fallax TaxID=1533 RepID=A0A1M4ZCU2_9CLOT|nr:glycosyltransferase [Clostridium fallax]SHF15778.1 Glycosyltransferase involved in cell wall bisynthesis [Clostridium fallax]SQB06288.1 group 1 glycosyl transferase [Clostridium fallax]